MKPTLPDGFIVRLNAQNMVSYAHDFAKTRDV